MSEKIYIETEVKFYPDGKFEPVWYIWEGEKIEIDRVLGVSLLFGGAAGAKYSCESQGKQIDLFFDVNRWYIKQE